MRIFITGASGYVGSVVTEKAIEQGHTVIGLARSEASAGKLTKMGATPVRGTLEDLELLTKTAKEADAVLHLGFVHEFNRPFDELVAIDIAAIEALGKGILHSNKPLIMTSGTGVVVPDNGKETFEDSKIIPENHRVRGEEVVLKLADQGVRAIGLRLAPYVYGRGGSYFLPMNMQAAAQHGFAPYIGDGQIMTTAADVDATADLYLLAMEKAKSGSIFNCSTETNIRIKDMADAIGKALSVQSKSVSFEEASEMIGPFVANFLQFENRASNEKARRELGWQPVPKFNFLDDIVKGSYKEFAAKLKSEVVAAS